MCFQLTVEIASLSPNQADGGKDEDPPEACCVSAAIDGIPGQRFLSWRLKGKGRDLI